MTPEWVVVAASVASGVLGSIVTTYGTQARERRTARTEVRKHFQRVERLARHRDLSQEYYWQVVASLDDLEGAMLVAGMPRYVAAFYRRIQLLAYATHTTTAPEERNEPKAQWIIAARVSHRTGDLLADTIWHPWLSAPTRRLRMRRLQKILERGMPERTRMLAENQERLRAWERDILRGTQET
jgi:hypothetical protein